MNKILALTIFRSAKSDFKKKIGVILQGSDWLTFGKQMDGLLLGFGDWRLNIHVFDSKSGGYEDRIRGYRLSEILIEGDSIPKESLDSIRATISSCDYVNESQFILDKLGVSVNKNWEDQKVFFSE